MGFLDFIKIKIKITDPAYQDIPEEHFALYQYFFDKLIALVDVNNYTNWAQNKKFNQEQLDQDDEKMYEFVTKEFINTDLSTGTIQVMVHQYFFADTYQRFHDKKDWVLRVLKRKEVDYFPSAWAIVKILGMD